MTIKTDFSRFDIHDELTAPDGSVKILRGVQSAAGGAVSKFIGVLAGSPSALRAFTRMRHELRDGKLPRQTRERIALAVAERRGGPPPRGLTPGAARGGPGGGPPGGVGPPPPPPPASATCSGSGRRPATSGRRASSGG